LKVYINFNYLKLLIFELINHVTILMMLIISFLITLYFYILKLLKYF